MTHNAKQAFVVKIHRLYLRIKETEIAGHRNEVGEGPKRLQISEVNDSCNLLSTDNRISTVNDCS